MLFLVEYANVIIIIITMRMMIASGHKLPISLQLMLPGNASILAMLTFIHEQYLLSVNGKKVAFVAKIFNKNKINTVKDPQKKFGSTNLQFPLYFLLCWDMEYYIPGQRGVFFDEHTYYLDSQLKSYTSQFDVSSQDHKKLNTEMEFK